MLTGNGENNFVSRAEGKLAGAVRAFSFDFRGKVVLDVGSSTGGFTEFAISHGAKKVIAVEKGTRQMKMPLRVNPKVELYEKTDIMTFSMPKKEKIDVVLADVSFMSLKPVLMKVRKNLAGPETEYLVMMKPQFEAEGEDLVNGVVKNEKIRRGIIKDFEIWLKKNNFVVMGKRDSEVRGKNGNKERFYYLKSVVI